MATATTPALTDVTPIQNKPTRKGESATARSRHAEENVDKVFEFAERFSKLITARFFLADVVGDGARAGVDGIVFGFFVWKSRGSMGQTSKENRTKSRGKSQVSTALFMS